MKRRLKATLAWCISVLLVLSVTMPAFARPQDVKGHWAEATINKWLDKGWIKGLSDGSFGPERLMQKCEFAALVNRALGFSEGDAADVSDVSEKDWFAGDIYKGIAAGYLDVSADGTIQPRASITRGDIAVLICRLLGPEKEITNDETSKFKDLKDISNVKRTAINMVLALGIMKGCPDNLFMPEKFLTRAQGVVILDNMLAAMANNSAHVIRSIKSISATNGNMKVVTSGDVKGLTEKDLVIEAKLDGKDYTLNNLVFHTSDVSFDFTPVSQTYAEQKLDIKISAAADSTRIKGSASATVVINALAIITGYSGGGSTATPVPTATATPAPAKLNGINPANGSFILNFDGQASGLNDDDFNITATLDGQPYLLQNLVFDQSANSFSFTPVTALFTEQKLEITVSAVTNSAKVTGSAVGSITIAGDPNANPKIIKGIDLKNGSIQVNFNGDVTGLSIDDFDVTAQLNGEDYTLTGASFDADTNSFSFTPVSQTVADQELTVTVAAVSDSPNSILGNASKALTIKGFHNFIELRGFNLTYTSGGFIDWCEVDFGVLSGMGSLQDVTVSLFDGTGALLASSVGTGVPFDETTACYLNVIADETLSNEEGEIQTLAAPVWTTGTEWNPNADGTVNTPQRVVIEARTLDGQLYTFDSQDTVWVDLAWTGNTPYDQVNAGVFFGLNAFADIQSGIDAVNAGGRVIVAQGEYTVAYNEYTGYYGIVIYKPLTLLGAQADVLPVENQKRNGGESIISGGTMDVQANGGGAITICKNAGCVEINGFTFKYNEVGLDVSVYNGDPEAVNADGLVVKCNRFIDNSIDIFIDNNDSYIQNYFISDNVFGLKEVDKMPYITTVEVRDVVNAAHKDFETAAGNGSYITLDLSFGLFIQNTQGLIFEGNTVYGKTIGVGIVGGTDAGNSINNSYFHGNRFAIGLLGAGSANSYTVDINRNILINNTLGLASLLSGKINATENYWGDVNWINIRTAILGETDVDSAESMVEYFPWALDTSFERFANSDLSNIVVNVDWAETTVGQQVIQDGKDYYIYVNAYPDIQTAVNNSSSDYIQGLIAAPPVINIVPGTYAESVSMMFPATLRGLIASENSGETLQAETVTGAVVNGSISISSYLATTECFAIEGLDIGGNLEIYAAGNVSFSGNKLAEGKEIIFYSIPDTINGKGQADVTAEELSEANNGAPVRFAAADILSFTVTGNDGENIINQLGDSFIDYEAKTILFKMPYGTDLTSLKPVITTSPKSAVSPASETVCDFSSPVQFTVTAGDGETTQVWTATCISEPVITDFTVASQPAPALIDSLGRAITIHVPFGTDIEALTPAVTVSDGASAQPVNSPVFTATTDPKIYTAAYKVISQDTLNSWDWTVTCIVDPNMANDILSFKIVQAGIPAQEGEEVIDTDSQTVTFWLPNASEFDLNSLEPVIMVSTGAAITLDGDSINDSGLADFTQPVFYYVTSESGEVAIWTVTCVPYSAQNDITGFTVEGEIPGKTIIDPSTHTISFVMAAGTDVSALKPTITVSLDAGILPASGEPKDFRSPVVYLVTAKDGTSQEWTVTCYFE